MSLLSSIHWFFCNRDAERRGLAFLSFGSGPCALAATPFALARVNEQAASGDESALEHSESELLGPLPHLLRVGANAWPEIPL